MVSVSYDYLQSASKKGKSSFVLLGTSFEEVVSLPITFLNLNEELSNLFVKKTISLKDGSVTLFTIGSLLSLGKKNVSNYLSDKGYSSAEIKNLIYKLELSLAKFSLKFKDTDFTVFDIKVADLDLGNEAKAWAKRNEFYEVGDLYLLGSVQFNKVLLNEKNGIRIKKDLLSALKKFGTAPEGNDVRLVFIPSQIKISRSDKKEKSTITSIEQSFFPAISSALHAAKQMKNTSGSQISISFFDGADFSNVACDYSNMIKVLKQKYVDLSQFMAEARITLNTLTKIKNGEEISPRLVSSISAALGINYMDVVRYKNSELKDGERIVIDNNDYTNMFLRMKSMYGSRKAFCDASNISFTTINNIYYKRNEPNATTLKKICTALRCKKEDIVTFAKSGEVQQQIEEEKAYYDYSKMKELLLSRSTPFTLMCDELGISRSRSILSRQMSFGIKFSDEILNKIAKYLNVKPEELYSKSIGHNPNAECDWTKLKNIIEQHMTSINAMCNKLKIHESYVAMRINYGKAMNKKVLSKIAIYLSCRPEDLYTPIRTEEEIAIRNRRSKIRSLPKYDYTKLQGKCSERSIGLAELSKQLFLSKGFVDKVVRMRGLGYRDIDKLCLYFDCKPEDLFDGPHNLNGKGTDKDATRGIRKVNQSNDCDYTPLLQRVLLNYENLLTFITKTVGLSPAIASKIYSGNVLSFTSYKKISNTLNVPIEKLVIFNNPEFREKILKQMKNYEVYSKNGEYDYSNLFRLMSEKNIKKSDLIKNGMNYPTYNRLLYGKKVGAKTILMLSRFVGCKPSEIATRRLPKKNKPIKTYDQEVDYSILISIIEKNMLTVYSVCKMAGLSISVANAITHGQKIKKTSLEKICEVLDLKPDFVMLNEPSPKKQEKRKSKSFVNTKYGEAAVRVKPAKLTLQQAGAACEQESPESKSNEIVQTEEPPYDSASKTNSENISGASVKNTSTKHDVKFYFSQNGYINLSRGEVKPHKNSIESDYTYDLQFGL